MSSPADSAAPARRSLTEILTAYQSVNNVAGTDKNTTHSYAELYEALYTSRRDSARAVLELGIYSGASVVVWAEYFASAAVVGADITLAHVRFGVDHPRIRMVKTDATVPAAIADVAAAAAELGVPGAVSYTHLTLPTNREV